MRYFDRKLNGEVHRYKAEKGLQVRELAKLADIDENRMYQFTAGNRPLKGEEIKRLLDAMGLTFRFVDK